MSKPDPFIRFKPHFCKNTRFITSTFLDVKEFCLLMWRPFKQSKEIEALRKLSILAHEGKRLSVFARDGYCCSVCRKTTPHIEIAPIQEFDGIELSKYAIDELTTLCPECLKDQSFRIRQEGLLVQSLRSARFKPAELIVLSSLIDTDSRFVQMVKDEIERFAYRQSTKAHHHSITTTTIQ